MKPTLFVIGLAVLLTAAGCGRADESADMSMKEPVAGATPAQNESSGDAKLVSQERSRNAPPVAPKDVPVRAVIRNGTLSVRVENVEKAEDKVGELVQRIGGYVDSASSSDLASATPLLTMKLRIPSSHFDSTMDGLEALGVRTAKTVKSEDVTGSLVDMTARLKIMKAQEEVYRRMLAKAGGSQEMMEAQDKIMNLRGSIESLEAQHKSLSKLASLSTIELTLQQSSESAVLATTDPNWAREAWGSSMSTMGNVARVFGSGLIWTVVFAPFWIPAFLLARAFWRKSQPSPGPKFDISA